MSEGEATSVLTAAGFNVEIVSVETTNEAQNGVVLSSSPSGQQTPGTTITLSVGVWDSSTGTTTTTTTTPDTTTTTTGG
jgi:beta-lactam-binding protein with PASTA domain